MKLGVLQHLLRTPHLKSLKIAGVSALTYLNNMVLQKLCMDAVVWVPIPMGNNSEEYCKYCEGDCPKHFKMHSSDLACLTYQKQQLNSLYKKKP